SGRQRRRPRCWCRRAAACRARASARATWSPADVGDRGITGGDRALLPPHPRLGLSVRPLLAVVGRGCVRVPEDLAHVVGGRVVVRPELPEAGRPEFGWVGE